MEQSGKTRTRAKHIVLLLVLIVCLTGFLKILDVVWSKDSILIIDHQIVNWIYTFRTSWMTFIMRIITSLASSYAIAALTFILVFTFYIKNKNKLIIPLLVTVTINFLFVEIVKLVTARARPELQYALAVEKSYSFPSGHTLFAITFYGLLVLYSLMFFKNPKAKITSIIIGIILTVAIGFSRIYLGVHWPSDVLASLLIGTSWLCLVVIALDYRAQLLKML